MRREVEESAGVDAALALGGWFTVNEFAGRAGGGLYPVMERWLAFAGELPHRRVMSYAAAVAGAHVSGAPGRDEWLTEFARLWRARSGALYHRLEAFSYAALFLAEIGSSELCADVWGEVRAWKNRCGPASGLAVDAGRGLLALRLGLTKEAEQAFTDGVEWAERQDCPVELGRNLQGLAAVAEARGDVPAALDYLDRAAAQYQPRGVKLFLDQVIAAKVRLQGITFQTTPTSIDRVATAVASEHPDLATHAAPDGTVTLLFSDIEGSTPLNEQLGDAKWMELLRAHNTLVRKHLKAYSGFEVKSMGDGFMLAFASARRALECAMAIQAELGASEPMQRPEAAAATSSEPMQRPETAAATGIRVRIGLHTGEVVKEGDDFFGKDVNLAARIGAQAHGGQILVSALLHDLVAASGAFTFKDGRDLTLKGLAGAHRVYQVVLPN